MWLCGVQRHFVKKYGKSAALLMSPTMDPDPPAVANVEMVAEASGAHPKQVSNIFDNLPSLAPLKVTDQ